MDKTNQAYLDNEGSISPSSFSPTGSSRGPAKRVTMAENDTMKMDMPSNSPIKGSSSFTGPFRGSVRQKSTSFGHGLSIYEEDTSTMPTIAGYLRRFTIPGPNEDEENGSGQPKRKKTKLGTLLGVYLPTVQHILGVQMFLRLVWIVGVGGVVESFAMVFICCLCTFLTTISISAIATNGVIESGGAYFMISRNLGPEFGGAIGILYYLANAVATAMYLVGGVEILLMYIAPDLPQFGDPSKHNEADLFNNFRIYASGLLLLEFVVVAMGVKFVQFFAPISLACVIVSILSVYIGAFVANPDNSPMLCMLGDRLLKPSIYTWPNGTEACTKDTGGPLWTSLCGNGTCDPFFEENVSYVAGIPGFFGGIIKDNLWSSYLSYSESAPGQTGDGHREVTQDITTTFFIILAIFFPSVTGIFTGANMSGDLKDAQKSLPIGTIAAQLTTSFIYLSFVVVFGGTIHGALLRDKYGDSLNRSMVVAELAWPNAWVLLVGSFTSTFGAALQCLCSAPRLLQSISKDDVIPILRLFSVVTKRGEPLRALFLSTLIAEIAVLIGGIDYIAPVVDFFFLMCYCFVNIVCALQTLLNVPNWRPRFQFYHWSLSLIGAILCLFIMFATYWYFALVVLALCGFLYKYIEYKGAKKEWGDGLGGLALSTAQFSLLRVEESHMHPKNWRPQLLVLVKLSEAEAEANEKLLQLSGQLKAGQGLTIVATLIEGDSRLQQDRERAESDRQRLKRLMKDHKVKGFAQVVLCQHAYEIVGTLIQCVGIGGLRPNTVVVNWPTHWKDNLAKHDTKRWNFLDAIHRAAAMDICLLVPKGMEKFPEPSERLSGTVDVWWIMHDGGLLILLPFLMKQHKVWRQCKLRIFAVAQLHDNSVKMKQDLQRWVYQLRIDATVDVVEFSDSAISAYTYERTMIMEERNKLAHDYKLTRTDIEHEPQMLADRSRTFHNLRGWDGSTRRSPSGQRDSHYLNPDTSISMTKHESTQSTPIRSLSGRDSKRGRRQQVHPAINTSEDVNKNRALSADSSVNDEDEKKCVLFHLSRHDIPDYFDSTGPSSPTTPRPSGDDDVGEGPSEFTFSPQDWADELKRHVDWIEEKADTIPEIRIESPVSSVDEPSTRGHDGSANANVDSKFANLDKKKIRKMHSAVKLNRAIRERSMDSQLIVMNLPRPPRIREGLGNYMEYLEAMTDGLERVLLVRGTGREVITIYS